MDGVLIVDKPKGYTSHDIVSIIKKELNTKKVGHAGTLDPNATGVLPILLGKATKISKYLIEHNKKYRATLELGIKTDTGDSEGKIIKTQDNVSVQKEKIIEILQNFKGKQEQIPPIYSSIKINGKKAYEYARNGETVELKPREIEIYEIKLVENIDNTIIFDVSCSKGTYIRTLCEDIATALGTVGHMKELRRLEVDKFSIDNAVTIEEIRDKKVSINPIEIEEIFEDNEAIYLNEKKLQLFLNGVKLSTDKEDKLYRIYKEDKFIGLGIIQNKLLKRDIIVI